MPSWEAHLPCAVTGAPVPDYSVHRDRSMVILIPFRQCLAPSGISLKRDCGVTVHFHAFQSIITLRFLFVNLRAVLPMYSAAGYRNFTDTPAEMCYNRIQFITFERRPQPVNLMEGWNSMMRTIQHAFLLLMILLVCCLSVSALSEAPSGSSSSLAGFDEEEYIRGVHDRYLDFWTRRRDVMLSDDVMYKQIITSIQDGKAAKALADFAARMRDSDLNELTYLQQLMTIICLQESGFTGALNTMKDYDTVRDFGDYIYDVGEVMLDALGAADIVSASAGLIADLVDNAGNSIKLALSSFIDYKKLTSLANSTKSARVFLQTVRTHTRVQPLRNAADALLEVLNSASQMVADGELNEWFTSTSADLCMTFGMDLMPYVLERLETMKISSDTEALFRQCSPALKGIYSGLGIGKLIYDGSMLLGNVTFGLDNILGRYCEMVAMEQIEYALSISVIHTGTFPAYEEGIEGAAGIIPIMQSLLIVRQRGEYCAKQLSHSEGSFLSWMHDHLLTDSTEKIDQWFQQESDVLQDMYSDLELILCRGNERFYHYLRAKLLPEYGWATLEEANIEYSNTLGKQTWVQHAESYQNKGGTVTGVLSADVRDYDLDGSNDMLVFFVETTDLSKTAWGKLDKHAVERSLGRSKTAPVQAYTLHAVLYSFDEQSNVIPVYDAPGISFLEDVSYGPVLAGIYEWKGRPYVYTYCSCQNPDTYGPTFFQIWHVEDGHLIQDHISGIFSWGQRVFGEKAESILDVTGMSISNTPLQDISAICSVLAWSTSEAERQQAVEKRLGTSLMSFVTVIPEPRGGHVQYLARDYSRIRKILEIGEYEALKDREKQPGFYPYEGEEAEARREKYRTDLDVLSDPACALPYDSASPLLYAEAQGLLKSSQSAFVSATQEDALTPSPSPSPSPSPEPTPELLKEIRFEEVALTRGQSIPVYSAPSSASWRGAKGKARVSTDDTVWAAGYEADWMLVMYETSKGSVRVGYVSCADVLGPLPSLGTLAFEREPLTVSKKTAVTDDVTKKKSTITTLKKGTEVTKLCSWEDWIYIETSVKGKTVRGFIPAQ